MSKSNSLSARGYLTKIKQLGGLANTPIQEKPIVSPPPIPSIPKIHISISSAGIQLSKVDTDSETKYSSSTLDKFYQDPISEYKNNSSMQIVDVSHADGPVTDSEIAAYVDSTDRTGYKYDIVDYIKGCDSNKELSYLVYSEVDGVSNVAIGTALGKAIVGAVDNVISPYMNIKQTTTLKLAFMDSETLLGALCTVFAITKANYVIDGADRPIQSSNIILIDEIHLVDPLYTHQLLNLKSDMKDKTEFDLDDMYFRYNKWCWIFYQFLDCLEKKNIKAKVFVHYSPLAFALSNQKRIDWIIQTTYTTDSDRVNIYELVSRIACKSAIIDVKSSGSRVSFIEIEPIGNKVSSGTTSANDSDLKLANTYLKLSSEGAGGVNLISKLLKQKEFTPY